MNLTGRQRANLRRLANGLNTILHVGKDGIGENLIRQASDALEARELIKGRVLDNNPDYDARQAAEVLAQKTDSQIVQVIGSRFVLYRESASKPKDERISPDASAQSAKHSPPSAKHAAKKHSPATPEKFGKTAKPVSGRQNAPSGTGYRSGKTSGTGYRSGKTSGTGYHSGQKTHHSSPKPHGSYANAHGNYANPEGRRKNTFRNGKKRTAT